MKDDTCIDVFLFLGHAWMTSLTLILSIILPFIIILHASVTNGIFQLPKQTGENKNWHTRQQKILAILIQNSGNWDDFIV